MHISTSPHCEQLLAYAIVVTLIYNNYKNKHAFAGTRSSIDNMHGSRDAVATMYNNDGVLRAWSSLQVASQQ
jgi:hypothetical protein